MFHDNLRAFYEANDNVLPSDSADQLQQFIFVLDDTPLTAEAERYRAFLPQSHKADVR